MEIADKSFLLEMENLEKHRLQENFDDVPMGSRVASFANRGLASISGVAALVESKDRKHGIDLFHKYQGVFKFPTNPPKPVDFVIWKASEGLWSCIDDGDDRFDILRLQAEKASSSEAYHYGRTASAVTTEKEYSAFGRSIGNYRVDRGWYDFESYNNTIDEAAYEKMLRWLERVDANLCPAGFYTNRSLYLQMNSWGEDHKKWPFWYANYWNPVADPFVNDPVVTDAMHFPHTWQYGIAGGSYGNNDVAQDFGVESARVDVNVRFEPRDVVEEETPTQDLQKVFDILSEYGERLDKIESRLAAADVTIVI